MRKAAVIGHPIKHSLSPLIHNYWFEQNEIYASYKAIDIPPENLKREIGAMAFEDYAGFNATLPHKVAVMEFCDTVDPAAVVLGAVNTVVINKDGRLHGMNTDAFGFIENLKDHLDRWRPAAGPVMVLGAGGAARGVVYALILAGVPEIIVTNRTESTAHALAKSEFCGGRVTVVPWGEKESHLARAHLLVNATSLGMHGQPPLEIDLTHATCPVYDIVYRPLFTPLLLQAQKRGLPVVTGLGMLLHQARPAFQAWFGVMPIVDLLLIEKAQKAAMAL